MDDVIHLDLRLPDDEGEEALLKAEAERLFPGDPLGLFKANWLRLNAPEVVRGSGEDGWW